MKWLLLIVVSLVIAALIRGRLLGRSAAGTSPAVDIDDGMRAPSVVTPAPTVVMPAPTVVKEATDAGPADGDSVHTSDDSSDSGSNPQAFATLTTAAAGAFGSGSADPAEDGSGPAGYDIKGNADSMLYHPANSPYFGRTRATVWFDSETSADAAGFTRWDRRDRNAGGSRHGGDAPDGA